MSIPKYDELYMPMLRALSDGKVHTIRELANIMAPRVGVTPQESQSVSTNSGGSVYYKRVSWTCSYLKFATLIERVSHGRYRLTEEGRRILANPPATLDNHFLLRYPSFHAFYYTHRKKEDDKASANSQKADKSAVGGKASAQRAEQPETVPKASDERTPPPFEVDETPYERIEQACAELHEALCDELLFEIMSKDSAFFGNLVISLLSEMGYGGPAFDEGVRVQLVDDGIYGVVQEDSLGFDWVYIRAKKADPEQSIDMEEILKFSGALQVLKASRGLFVTTSQFTEKAKASAQQEHIVLMDGSRLANLMIEYNVGVSSVAKYEIKAIDSDFFNDEKA